MHMCYDIPPWFADDPTRLYPPVDLRKVFIRNKQYDEQTSWQFFATESGLHTVFPAALSDVRKHCHYVDPRLKYVALHHVHCSVCVRPLTVMQLFQRPSHFDYV